MANSNRSWWARLVCSLTQRSVSSRITPRRYRAMIAARWLSELSRWFSWYMATRKI